MKEKWKDFFKNMNDEKIHTGRLRTDTGATMDLLYHLVIAMTATAIWPLIPNITITPL